MEPPNPLCDIFVKATPFSLWGTLSRPDAPSDEAMEDSSHSGYLDLLEPPVILFRLLSSFSFTLNSRIASLDHISSDHCKVV